MLTITLSIDFSTLTLQSFQDALLSLSISTMLLVAPDIALCIALAACEE